MYSAKTNKTVAKTLLEDELVFFIHLIATDTLGHGKKPASQEYPGNVLFVDKQIRRAVESVEKYFLHDEKTAYVVTSDHGMTDQGSHGGGSWEETETPIIAWGAGIRGPDQQNMPSDTKLHFKTLKQYDIDQIGIAPLMASLIGVPYPMNSMGILPLDYLITNQEFQAEALYANAEQILALCEAKRQLKETTAITFFFQESELTKGKQEEMMKTIKKLIGKGKFREAIDITNDLIRKMLKTIRYFETYDRLVLNVAISIGFISWMIHLLGFILDKYTDLWTIPFATFSLSKQISSQKSVLKIAVVPIIILLILLKAKNASEQFYAYLLVPTILLVTLYYRLETFQMVYKFVKKESMYLKLLVVIMAALFVLEVLVISLFYREILTLGLLILSSWPWFTILKTNRKYLTSFWTVTVIGLSLFPLFPIVGKKTNYTIVIISGILALTLAIYCVGKRELWYKKIFSTANGIFNASHESFLVIFQFALLCLSILVKYNTINSFETNRGLLLSNQVIAWTILAMSFALPFFTSTFLLQRLFHISVSLTSVYLLMSTSYETLFLLCLCSVILLWILCEHQLSSKRNQNIDSIKFSTNESSSKLTFEDIGRACFFLLFIFTAFFGTGNIASISSFDPASLYCFMTVFNPFAMGFLLSLKIMIPFLIVTCGFYCIVVVVRIPVWSLFSLILLMSDFISFHFFLQVQDVGSWLDIGSSISRYIVMMVVTIFVIILYFVSQYFTTKQFTLAQFLTSNEKQC